MKAPCRRTCVLAGCRQTGYIQYVVILVPRGREPRSRQATGISTMSSQQFNGAAIRDASNPHGYSLFRGTPRAPQRRAPQLVTEQRCLDRHAVHAYRHQRVHSYAPRRPFRVLPDKRKGRRPPPTSSPWRRTRPPARTGRTRPWTRHHDQPTLTRSSSHSVAVNNVENTRTAGPALSHPRSVPSSLLHGPQGALSGGRPVTRRFGGLLGRILVDGIG